MQMMTFCCALLLSSQLLFAGLVKGWGWNDVTDPVEDGWDDVTDGTDDLIDTVVPAEVATDLLNDAIDIAADFKDSVAGNRQSVGTALTGAADSSTRFLKELGIDASTVSAGIRTVAYVAADAIDIPVPGFNDLTWAKVSTAAKYLIYTLPTVTQLLLKTGLNYLNDLLAVELAPFPLNQLEKADVKDVAKCVGNKVFDFMVEWAQDVGTAYVSEADFTVTPILNTEAIKEPLTDTLECIQRKAAEIWEREQLAEEPTVDSVLQAAYDWIAFEDDMVVALEVTFSACTLVCGSVGIGLAASATQPGLFGAYMTTSGGLDLSPTVGAALTSAMSFYPNWHTVESQTHVVAFDVDLPIIPDFIPEIGLHIANNGDFAGMALTSDIIDLELGLLGVFGQSYDFAETSWVKTTVELADAWNVASKKVAKELGDSEKEYTEKFEEFVELISSGSLMKEMETFAKPFGVISTKLYQTFSCPADEDTTTNRDGSVNLGYINLQSVHFGNRTERCNGSDAFDLIWQQCAYTSQCTVGTYYDALSKDGTKPCAEGIDVTLEVVYTCSGSTSAYDLSCFGARFKNIIEKQLYQDYEHEILMDDWEERVNEMGKCAAVAQELGLEGFATYNHGMCIAFKKLFREGQYNEYNITYKDTVGSGSECPTDGLGDVDDWNVYAFVDKTLAFDDLGCHNLSALSEIWGDLKSVEGTHYLSQDDYSTRLLAINKCAQMADDRNSEGFLLTDGGKCFVGDKLSRDQLEKRGVNTSQGHDCYGSKGSRNAANVYYFPHYDKKSSKSGLSATEIAMAVVFPILFVIIVAFGLAFTHRKEMWNWESLKTGWLLPCGNSVTQCSYDCFHGNWKLCCRKEAHAKTGTGDSLEMHGKDEMQVK